MRNVLFGLASLLAATSVAHADPLAVAAHASDSAAPTTYVQGGLMLGGAEHYSTGAFSAEVGKRLVPHLWVHGSVADGFADLPGATGSGSIRQVRAGADAMTCTGSGVYCAYLGGDAGYQRTQFSGYWNKFWPDTGVDYTMPVNKRVGGREGMIGVARAGLDIGGKHVRWRPGIEASFAGDGLDGVNITQSLAYRF